ncbi:transglycosylase domain-containing protein [Oceanobacillus halotolerans]|uniref:transglycosylase domain-containing protein n=1 Tax=Oceanobacillus halotolerans TaxID=2663380 RepID=UPI0013DC4419|nr:PBP1A family penicillin-binding protein [Oceanobacillus halotolerans]
MRQFITWKRFIISILVLVGISFTAIGCIYVSSYLLGPPPLTSEQNTIYYSQSGEVIGEERGVENRYWISLDEMPETLIQATLAIEDQHFYDHNGFDLKRILGAALSDLKSLSLKEGASTLTQQYARNLYLSHEKTWTRKLKEAFYTIRLEMHYSKDEILEGYLNTIYYGHGAYGVEAASRHFFDKHGKDLTLAEAAMLAGVPKGPTYYSPLNDMERAKSRQRQILTAMLEEGYISQSTYHLASREQLAIQEHQENQEDKMIAPHFQDMVLREAAARLQLDEEKVRSGGYKIYTTLDKNLQVQLEESIANAIESGEEIEVGSMTMEPSTGRVLAMVGGKNYEDSQFNRVTQAKRMPGSTFKPFLYYAALENGYNARTRLMSKPTAFELENGEVYQPSNFNDHYANEPITLAQAIALSDNIYAVKTNLYLGVDKLVNAAKKFGINQELPEVPSLALGTASVTVNDMVTAYSMLANGGKAVEGYTIGKIVDRNGSTVYERQSSNREQVLDPVNAFILTHLMTGMFDPALNGYMSVTGSSIADQLTRTYAGKSGTTNTDSWMIGFSPDIVTGVWTGYDDNRQLDPYTETAYAKDIWATFMESAHQGLPLKTFDVPANVVGVPIDPTSGKRATPYCDTSHIMYFRQGEEPNKYCNDHFHEAEERQDKEGPTSDQQEEDKGIFERWFDTFF